MKNTMGIINNTCNEKLLKELMNRRSLGSVPFAGRYRLIDFILSNMVNSGINNVGILVQNNIRSLMAHIRSGKEWELDRKIDGLSILPPMSIRAVEDIPKGDLEVFNDNMDFLQNCTQKYVIVSDSNYIYNMDFNDAIRAHIESGADITLVYREMGNEIKGHTRKTVISLDGKNNVRSVEINPVRPLSHKECMEVYIMERELLIDLINKCIAEGRYDFKHDCIARNVDSLNIQGYEFKGFMANIHSIRSYYKYSMQLLKTNISKELFYKNGLIYTSVKDQPPVKYTKNSSVKNSLIANGCIIDGNVENSILFRGVRVEKGACVKNSIVMQNCTIQENSCIDNIILDKDVTITYSKQLIGAENYPVVVEKTVTL